MGKCRIFLLVLALLLSGCTPAIQPSEGTSPAIFEEEVAFAKCFAALEDLHSYDCYAFTQENTLEGDDSLNDSSTTYFYKNGEDWLYYYQIPMGYMLQSGGWAGDSIIAYLCKDGQYFNTEREGYVDELSNYHWGKSQAPKELSPWFYTFQEPWPMSFDWHAQEMSHISIYGTQNDGQLITLSIPGTYKNRDTSGYTASFYFDSQDRLEKIVLEIDYLSGSGTPGRDTITVRLVSTDPKDIQTIIDDHYQNALAGCGNLHCQVCYPEDP